MPSFAHDFSSFCLLPVKLLPKHTARTTKMCVVCALAMSLHLVFPLKYFLLPNHISDRFMKTEVFLHHVLRLL